MADDSEPSRRLRLSPDERREQLVALGVNALAEQPLDRLSIGALAASAGVSRPLFSHYFGSKQGFQRAVVKTARDSMLRATEPRPELEALDRLRDTLARTVGFVREHRGTFHSLVRGTASGDPQVREVVEQARALQADRVVALFVERGCEVSPAFRAALRAWIAFVEQMLVDPGSDGALGEAELVGLMVAALEGVSRAADPAAAAALFG